MRNLFKSLRNAKWWPDADLVNTPEGALPRADNLIPAPEAQLSLRPGSAVRFNINTSSGALPAPTQDYRVHSLYSCILREKIHNFAGANDQLFSDGENIGQVFDGQGDIIMGDDAYQAFFARGTTKKKFDGLEFHNWPIPAPQYAPTVTAIAAITTAVASFDSAESPGFNVNEGTGSFVTGHDGTGSGALRLVPDANSGRASASKIWGSDQDFLNIKTTPGGDTDLFDVYTWFEEPNDVDKLTIMFGLGTGADAYKDDYYYFDFNIGDEGTVDVKDGDSSVKTAQALLADQVTTPLTPQEVTEVQDLEQITSILKRLGRFAGPRSRERKDSQEASPAWTHLSVTRGQFNRVGGTAGRDWKTVRGFKVVYTGKIGSVKAVQFDNAVYTGGGNRALTGRFMVGFRYARDFEDKYIELSPISPISTPIDLTQQVLQITIPSFALSGKDPQVNQIWVYLFGGVLDTYYRVAIVSAVIRQGMTIDELTNPAGANFGTKSERTRLTAWGFTKITGGDAVQADLIFTLNKSELEILIENERLEPGASGIPDDVVAIAGPWLSRMYIITKEGRAFPTSQDSPSNCSLYHHLDLRRYGTPLWAVRTGTGILVGMTKDVIRIAGSGDESADRVSVDLYPEPQNVGNPPIDESVVTDGNAVVYRSADGPMMLTGNSLTPLPPAGTSMLWKGYDRHGVEALNTVFGRFRFGMDNHELFMIAPEGSRWTKPLNEAEQLEWDTLVGFDEDDSGVLTKTAPTGGRTTAVATKKLLSSDGYVEAVLGPDQVFLALSHQDSQSNFDSADFSLRTDGNGNMSVYEKGSEIIESRTPYVAGDVIRIEVENGVVKYKRNPTALSGFELVPAPPPEPPPAGGVVYTSKTKPTYPLVPDAGIQTLGSVMGPFALSGNWTLVVDGSDSIWRYSLLRQQWSRTVYPVRFCSMYRDPSGAMLMGTDEGGQVWEIEVGTQDNDEDIRYELRTGIEDGQLPLARKDALDFQMHADTGNRACNVGFALDGASVPDAADSIQVTTTKADVYQAAADHLGVFRRMQVFITGVANRFLLHAFNLTFRERVQNVMVLDTGTISPQGRNRLTWLVEGEIDCISGSDLEVDLYLDDQLKTETPISIQVLPNRRKAYRFALPKGSKASAPRLVFRTTAADGAGDPGFEAYRVRVRDRGTGGGQEAEFRPIWPIGTAP